MQVHFRQVLLNGIQIFLELRMLVKRSSRLVRPLQFLLI
jgi:hypothetical protein